MEVKFMSSTISNGTVITEIQTRFSDFDPLKHLNNSCYLSYIEIARVETFVNLLGLDLSKFSGVVKAVTVNYKKAVLYGTKIVTITKIKNVGETSLSLSFSVVNQFDHSIVYAEVELVQITISMETFKPTPHPASLIESIRLMNLGLKDTFNDVKMAS